MNPTHTHKERGGQFARIGAAEGEGQFAGQRLVIYLDLTTQPPATHFVTRPEWEAGWREIPADACPVCHGSGQDTIKKRSGRPCGGCYGLGRVRLDGERPEDLWELGEVARRIIGELRQQVARLEGRLALPGVAEAIAAEQARRQQAATDAQAEQERKWREGRGHGPGGARMTGD